MSRGETAAIFRALCRRRSRAAKLESQSRNGSKSPGRARSCGNMLHADICFLRRAASASATWPSRPKSIRRTRIESSRTCRSVDRGLATLVGRDSVEPSRKQIRRVLAGSTESRPTETPARQSLALPKHRLDRVSPYQDFGAATQTEKTVARSQSFANSLSPSGAMD